MDLEFTEEQKRFRRELSDWFDANAPRERFAPGYTDAGFAQLLEWDRMLYAAGYSAPGWPVDYGGLGADAWGQLIFDEEYARRDLPERLNKMGLLHGGPTILAHGTEQQKRDWLPGILDCSEIWCQGFSEPEAGSDLASLRTTGRIEGDSLVINGQKTWTSNGAIATRIFALVRTDPQAPPHRGITFVVFDLDLPGVELRPLRQLHGQSGFAEVFFTDVVVPLSHVVGDLNDGWRIAGTSLRLERGTGRGTQTRLINALHSLGDAVDADGAHRGAVETFGSLRAWTFAYEQSAYALTDLVERGGDDAVSSSINKLAWSEIQTRIYEEHLDILGPSAELAGEVGPSGELLGMRRNYWHARAAEIYAGANEIQRNIIAERGFGMPREPR